MLGDTTNHLSSDWSQGYSLDTVGVTQILNMHVKDGRSLEISLSISVAPGRLSQYTKIVRFSPRFVMVNKVPRDSTLFSHHKSRSISLWQDSSLLHNDFSSTVTGRWASVSETKMEKVRSSGEERKARQNTRIEATKRRSIANTPAISLCSSLTPSLTPSLTSSLSFSRRSLAAPWAA